MRAPRNSVRKREAATEVGVGWVGDWVTVRGFGVAQSLAGDGFDVLLLCYYPTPTECVDKLMICTAII